MTDKLKELSRLSIHTMTTKPWTLAQAIDGYRAAGVPGISVWREHLADCGLKKGAQLLHESGLKVVSLVRAGFFAATGAMDREKARTETRKAIDEASEIGAPVLVLVCGAVPGLDLAMARQQILDGIHAIEPHAKAAKIKLAIEPLHPMYADSRSAINTLEQANNLVIALDSPWVGVAVDVYHCWWDPFLRAEIKRAGKSLFAFHVCDWLSPTRDLLNDRGMMGDGCINIPEIREWVESVGFHGPIEVEIFSDQYWTWEQSSLVERIKQAYLSAV
jgi:sugar phosphate isomerase/epimerase